MVKLITKYRTVKVPYTVPTVSASHVSRLLAKLESPRQVPTWGEHTVGSLSKLADNQEWGWEVTKSDYPKTDEFVWVNYYRNSQMSSGRLEIEAIKVYLEEQGFEVSEPKYHYSKSYRRNSNGEYQDYEEERNVYVRVGKPEESFPGHCQTCLCEHAE